MNDNEFNCYVNLVSLAIVRMKPLVKTEINNGKEDSHDMHSFYIDDSIFNVQPCISTSSMLSALKGNYGENTERNLKIELIKNNQ